MKWLTRRKALILGVILLLIGGLVWFRSRGKEEKFELVTPTRKTITETLVGTGKVDADHKAVLRFPTSGKLSYISVSSGDVVKKGQLLSNMDTGDLQSAVTEAFYRYQAADANAKEVEDSVKGHSSDETFTQKNDRVAAQTARDIAYDNWLDARRALTYAYLYAPFAGVVSSVTVNTVGANVGVTDGMTVVQPASLYFATEVDETDLGKIKLGMEVEIDLDAFDQNFKGKIVSIGFETILSDTGATVLPVKVSIPEPELAKLKLGLNGDANIMLQTKDNVLVLPLEAVKGDEVTLADGNKRKVETGIVTDTDIEIVSGLNEGESVRL